MSDVTVTAENSGPYLVAGRIQLLDADGNAYAVDRDGDCPVPLRAFRQQAVLRWLP